MDDLQDHGDYDRNCPLRDCFQRYVSRRSLASSGLLADNRPRLSPGRFLGSSGLSDGPSYFLDNSEMRRADPLGRRREIRDWIMRADKTINQL